jgi:hypothetical protein
MDSDFQWYREGLEFTKKMRRRTQGHGPAIVTIKGRICGQPTYPGASYLGEQATSTMLVGCHKKNLVAAKIVTTVRVAKFKYFI